MANRYWVGGTATWDGTAGSKWSTTSGGAGGAAVPTAADDVFFDGSSGSGTVTTSGTTTMNCRSLNFTGFTGTFNHVASTTVRIGDSGAPAGSIALKIVSGMTYTKGNNTSSAFTLLSTNAGQQDVDSGGKSLGNLTFSGAGSSYRLVAALTSTGTISHTAGTLDINGQTCSVATLSSTGSTTRTLSMGASSFTITSGFTLSGTNLTFNCGTSTITYNGSVGITFAGNGNVFYNVSIQANTKGGISGANTFNNLTYLNGAATNSMLELQADQIVNGVFTVTSNSQTNRILVGTNSATLNRTITAASVSLTDVDFCGIVGAGAATWTGTRLGDATGNSGITFATPVTRYWVGGTGNSSDPTHWSTSSGGSSGASVPTINDTAIFDANSFTAGSQSVTQTLPRFARTLDFSAVTNNPTVNWIGSHPATYGTIPFIDLLMGTLTIGTGTWYFGGSADSTYTPNGVSTKAFTIQKRTGYFVVLAGDVTFNASTENLSISSGGLDTAGYDMVIGGVTMSTDATLSRLRDSNIEITGTNGWFTSSALMDPGTSTVLVSNSSATQKTMGGAGLTFFNLTLTGDNIMMSGNTIIRGTLALNNAGTTNGTKLNENLRLYVNRLTSNGSVGNLARLYSRTVGTVAYLEVMRGIINEDYMNIKDVAVRGPGRFFAGVNSTDGGNNTNVVFADGSKQSAAESMFAFARV